MALFICYLLKMISFQINITILLIQILQLNYGYYSETTIGLWLPRFTIVTMGHVWELCHHKPSCWGHRFNPVMTDHILNNSSQCVKTCNMCERVCVGSENPSKGQLHISKDEFLVCS